MITRKLPGSRTVLYFLTILLVFTDYKPKTHDLQDLNKQVCYADARFKIVSLTKLMKKNALSTCS